MSPQSVQLPDGRIIRCCNYPSIGASSASAQDKLTGRVIKVGSVSTDIFADYIHVFGLPLNYPQKPGAPPGTLINSNLWITGKGFKNLVTEVKIGANVCTDIIYAASVSFRDSLTGITYTDRCALQCTPPVGIGKGDYDVVVTVGGVDYQATLRSANIQFHIKEASDGWSWTYDASNNITSIVNPDGVRTYTYVVPAKPNMIINDIADIWTITW